MSFCSKCGNEVSEEVAHCPNCGEALRKGEVDRRPTATQAGAMDHLTLGFNLAVGKPMVFVPAILSGVISILIYPIFFILPGFLFVLSYIVSYVLNFASIDMSRDAYMNKPLNLMGSVNYVLSRIFTFIIASIIGTILSITIILFPVAILMFVIMVIDETSIGDAISKAFSVLTKNLGAIIIIVVVGILGSLVLGLVPFIGGLLTACLNVIIDLAFINLYSQQKR